MNTNLSQKVPFFARNLDRHLAVRTGLQAGQMEQQRKNGG